VQSRRECLIALDCQNGKRLWHFQENSDMTSGIGTFTPAKPRLPHPRCNGGRCRCHKPKNGETLLLDRVTGKSDLPGPDAPRANSDYPAK